MPTPVSTGQITIVDVMDGLNMRLNKIAHLVPAGADGSAGDFTGCVATASVWQGSLEDTANWVFTAVPSGGVTGSMDGATYTVTGMTGNAGYVDFLASRVGYSSLVSRFAIAKANQGAVGATGPVVMVTANRATTFNAVDGALVAGQADILFTAAVLNIAAPTYVWTFSGFQTAPTASTTSSQTITAAQFGTSTSATVTCTVNGTYVDKVTIVRLEKSTAAAGATVGATWGGNLVGQPNDADLLNLQGNFQAVRAWTFDAASSDGWINVNNSVLTPGVASLAVTSTGSDPGIRSPAFSVYGPANTKVRARLRRTGGTNWAGEIYYSTGAHGDSGGDAKVIAGPVGNAWQVMEWDMSAGPDWTGSNITNLRLDLGNVAGDNFEVDWIAIGSTSPSSYGAPSGSAVGNSSADAVSAATVAVNDGTTGLNQRMRANADNILGGVLKADTALVPVGLRVGSVSWNAAGNITGGAGLAITSKGIYGYNGVKDTFSIDGTTGNATFAGELSAATGSFAGYLTAAAVNAVNTINIAGDAVTIPRHVYDTTYFNNPSGQVLDYTMNLAKAGNIIILWAAQLRDANGFSVSIYLNGVVVGGIGFGALAMDGPVAFGSGAGVQGSNTIQIIWNGGGAKIDWQRLTVLGAMR